MLWNLGKATFGPSLPQLPILDKPCKHLGLHEDAKETAYAFGRHRLPEGFSLEDALPALFFSDEEGVMSDGLQEEADEGLRHQAVQGVVLYRHKGDVQRPTNYLSIQNEMQQRTTTMAELNAKHVITLWWWGGWGIMAHHVH